MEGDLLQLNDPGATYARGDDINTLGPLHVGDLAIVIGEPILAYTRYLTRYGVCWCRTSAVFEKCT